MSRSNPTPEESLEWAQQEHERSRIHRERKVSETAASRKKPAWWENFERELGEYIDEVRLRSGRVISFKRFEPGERKRVKYAWKLAAQALARGGDVFDAARAAGCSVEAVERRLRDGSRLARMVEEIRRTRYERAALKTEREGELYVNRLGENMKPYEDRGDRAFHRWLVQRMAEHAPPVADKPLKRKRKSAPKPAVAAPETALKLAPVSRSKPPLAETGPGKPESAPVSRNQRPLAATAPVASARPPAP
jgi:hypothetical protein